MAVRGASPSGRGSGGNFTTSTPFNPAVAAAAVAGATPVGLAVSAGFNYLINNSNFPGGVQAALHLLDTYGSTKVISNPYLAALDNQKATIKVGDSIPIASNSTVGGTTNVITTTSQYIDTGVLLQVTPHINAGGLVTMEVDAEVSTPGSGVEPGSGAADQYPLGADAARRAYRRDHGDGRPHHREQAEQLGRIAAHLAHSGARGACSALRR